ncbi:TetR/AcrR family transcriptional regulator [Spongiactinospora sp. 9N601]|uniref:TetR/AcrR family transcriptional regulator n=1 Tax=Spongiactinospora sp. 9N601 TaxID=3375149 RepID=UPI0037A3B352
MVAVRVGDEQRGQLVQADARLGQAQHGAAPRVELQHGFSVPDQDARARAARSRDRHTGAGIEDPAEVFAASVRLTGRMVDTHPQIARILTHTGLPYLDSDKGMAPRALRDIRHAMAAGRFRPGNPYVALAGAGGSLLGFLQLWLEHPDLVDEHSADELAENLLRMYGMSHEEAHAVANRPLPGDTRHGQ